MNSKLIIIYALLLLAWACKPKSTEKSVQGNWQPARVYQVETNSWKDADVNFYISISGECANIAIEKNNLEGKPDPIPLANCLCMEDKLITFTDKNTGLKNQAVYEFTLELNKDTLLGIVRTTATDTMKAMKQKVKFARLQSRDAEVSEKKK